MPDCFQIQFKMLVFTFKPFMVWDGAIWGTFSPWFYMLVPPEQYAVDPVSRWITLGRPQEVCFLCYDAHLMKCSPPGSEVRIPFNILQDTQDLESWNVPGDRADLSGLFCCSSHHPILLLCFHSPILHKFLQKHIIWWLAHSSCQWIP